MNRRKMRFKRNKITQPKSIFWTIEGKTIWDVLQLLIIPLVLAGIALMFNRSETRRSESIEATRIAEQQSIESDRANAELIRNYFNSMTELLLEKDLRSSPEESEVRSVARVITLSVLRSLEAEQKSLVVEFLIESNLVQTDQEAENNKLPVISLADADLRKVRLWADTLIGADLSGADLSGADLSNNDLERVNLIGANLSEAVLMSTYLKDADLVVAKLIEANLSGADLTGADLGSADLNGAKLNQTYLVEANLSGADLSGAELNGAILIDVDLTQAKLIDADLSGANVPSGIGADLTRAIVANEQLAKAKSLTGATMPDGKVYDPAIHTEIARLRREAGLEP